MSKTPKCNTPLVRSTHQCVQHIAVPPNLSKEKSGTERQHNRKIAVTIYDRIYKERSGGRPFSHPAVITEMATFGTGKHIKPFDDVCKFLENLRDASGGVDELTRPLNDYFHVLFDYYKKFGRYPTLKQMAGPTAQSDFISFVHKSEDEEGAYWMDKDTYDRIQFSKKWGWGKMVYDPILPHTWKGPGNPALIPALNKKNLPIRLGFRELVKYKLIDPPQEVIDEYNRLYLSTSDLVRFVGDNNPKYVSKPVPPQRLTPAPPPPPAPPAPPIQPSISVERVPGIQRTPLGPCNPSRFVPGKAEIQQLPPVQRLTTGLSPVQRVKPGFPPVQRLTTGLPTEQPVQPVQRIQINQPAKEVQRIKPENPSRTSSPVLANHQNNIQRSPRR